MADIAIQVWHVRPEHILGHSTMRDAWLVSSHDTFQIKLRLRVSGSAQPCAPSLPFSSRWTKSKDKLPPLRSDLDEPFQFTSGFTHFCHFHFYNSSQSYAGFPYPIYPEGFHCRAEQGCLVVCILNMCPSHFCFLFQILSLKFVIPVLWAIFVFVILCFPSDSNDFSSLLLPEDSET